MSATLCRANSLAARRVAQVTEKRPRARWLVELATSRPSERRSCAIIKLGLQLRERGCWKYLITGTSKWRPRNVIDKARTTPAGLR